jgi:hypothetical protein
MVSGNSHQHYLQEETNNEVIVQRYLMYARTLLKLLRDLRKYENELRDAKKCLNNLNLTRQQTKQIWDSSRAKTLLSHLLFNKSNNLSCLSHYLSSSRHQCEVMLFLEVIEDPLNPYCNVGGVNPIQIFYGDDDALRGTYSSDVSIINPLNPCLKDINNLHDCLRNTQKLLDTLDNIILSNSRMRKHKDLISKRSDFYKAKVVTRSALAGVQEVRIKIASEIIQNGCHNWLYKPQCNDGSMGIVPRITLRKLENS